MALVALWLENNAEWGRSTSGHGLSPTAHPESILIPQAGSRISNGASKAQARELEATIAANVVGILRGA